MGFKYGKLSVLLLLCLVHSLTIAFTIPENETFLQDPHYHHTDDMLDLFARLSKEYPDLAKVHSIGASSEGRDLTVIEITKNVRKRSILVPMFKYVANMHGDETVGREMLIYLAEYLLANYGKIAEVTKLVDTTDIFLMPSMNPDGFENSKVSFDIGRKKKSLQFYIVCLTERESVTILHFCLFVPLYATYKLHVPFYRFN